MTVLQELSPSVAVRASAIHFHVRRSTWLPDPDLVVVACRCEYAVICRMPCNAIHAAKMCVEGFDKQSVRPPNVDSRVWNRF